MRSRLLVVALLCLLPSVVGAQSINYYPPSGSSTVSLTDITLYDEFCGGTTTTGTIGALGWASNVTPGTTTAVANRPCVITNTVGAANPGVLWLGGGGNTASTVAVLSDIKTALFVAAAPALANPPDLNFGLLSTNPAAAPADDGVYFEKLAADTNWFAVTRDAVASQTRTDTGVAYSGGTYVKFRIEHPSASVWQFYLNDALVATHTAANTPPAEATPVWLASRMETKGTAGAVLYDFASIRFTVTR